MDVSDPGLYEAHTFHPLFRELRATDPVHYCEESQYGPYWAVTRYDDIVAVDMNPGVFSSAAGGISIFDVPVDSHPSFINMDPPEHRLHRGAVTPAFSRENMAQLEDEVRERVSQILDRVPLNTPFDWVTTVANELPLQMLSTLFGIPEADRYHMLYWTNAQVAFVGGGRPDPQEAAQHPSFSEYFLNLRRQRTEEGELQPDLVSHLIHSPEPIADKLFLSHLRLLVVGANDTTRTSIAGGLEAVIEQDLYDTLRANPALIPSAVNEIVRFVTPVVHQRRTATQDYELGGKTIRKGDKVVMFYVSGNRDERAFADPDRLVLDRTEPRLLSFGSGIHHCIGFRLARLQLKFMWEGMLERFNGFELLERPTRLRSNFVQGFLSMPVIART
ncbi:MAG: cytochrome P450 [Pseudomonadota bacterium]